MEDESFQRNKELKQIRKLISKIKEINDSAKSYIKKRWTMNFSLLAWVLIFVIVFALLGSLGFLNNDNDKSLIKIKKHLFLFIGICSIGVIGTIIWIFFFVYTYILIRKIYVRLNIAVNSLYTYDVIDHEVQENIDQYKFQIQIFTANQYRNQISYIPKLSIATISFLQHKIQKLKRIEKTTIQNTNNLDNNNFKK